MLEVCRLCLGNKNLLDIFDCEPRNIVRLIKCISLATGIEVSTYIYYILWLVNVILHEVKMLLFVVALQVYARLHV